MILGIGSDLCDIRRIEETLVRFGERFTRRLFTPTERQRSEQRVGLARAASYAKRFAAKEACAKALGTGFRHGVVWHDLAVDNTSDGRPTIKITGPALNRLQALIPPGMIAQVDLSLSDEYPLAQAFVIISATHTLSPAPPAQPTASLP